MLLATFEDAAAGCVAVRPLANRVCELRRLFVNSASRSGGLGRDLVARAIEFAKYAGYQRVYLSTLPAMVHAIALYRNFGFADIPPYVQEPSSGVVYMALELAA